LSRETSVCFFELSATIGAGCRNELFYEILCSYCQGAGAKLLEVKQCR